MNGVKICSEARVEVTQMGIADLEFQFDQDLVQQGMGRLFVHGASLGEFSTVRVIL
ncbi:MAG: hypothetical protein PF483_12105 [Halothiobacillus sp.]|nr:hypothetical protein [Halothiobacillus sp.]